MTTSAIYKSNELIFATESKFKIIRTAKGTSLLNSQKAFGKEIRIIIYRRLKFFSLQGFI